MHLVCSNTAAADVRPARLPASPSAFDDRIARGLESEVLEVGWEVAEMEQQLAPFRKHFE